MGSVCSVEAHAPAGMSAATLTRAVDAALDEVERWDAVLSDWNPDTPLSRFNAAPADEPQPLSSDLAAWLAHATHWSARTEGAFDPTLGALVDAWGLRSRNPARPGPLALRSARDASALALLRFDPETRSATRLHAGLRLDPGASGKGWALGRARDVLVEHGVGRALLSFRSTLVALDPPPGEDGWRVPVAHDGSAEALLEFELVRQALSVSGGSLRGFDDGGVLRGHVIDATSGTPVPAGRLAWVLHDDPATSDALATALLVARDDLAPVDGAHGGWVDAADAELHTWGRAP